MKLKFLLPLLVLFAQPAFAQNVIVKGTAPGAGGKIIKLTCSSDFLTNRELLLSENTIGSDGNFILTAPIEHKNLISLSIDFHSATFFVEPGKTYEIAIQPYQYDDVKELNPFSQSQNLQIRFNHLSQNDLNNILSEFDGIYNNFLVENFNALYRDHRKSLLDTLRNRVKERIGEPEDSYAKSYIEYKLANVIQLTMAMNQAQIGTTYFTKRPVLYENVEYMDFFSSYFSKYMTATSRVLKKNDYHTLLAGKEPYVVLMKALSQDSVLKPENLRELVLLKGLWEIFNTTQDDRNHVLSVLSVIERKSTDGNNRLIAGNIIKTLTDLEPGYPAPLFQLRDLSRKRVSLDSLKGTIVVLNFWTTDCESCLGEMDKLPELSGKFKGKVRFISISTEYSFLNMLYFVSQKKDWNWTFLHVGDQVDILKAYDVRILPLFVVIDREGNIFRYNADGPGHGLENIIEQLIQISK
jgi:peroxiredoxin